MLSPIKKKLFIYCFYLSCLIITLLSFSSVASSNSLGGFVAGDRLNAKKVAQRRTIGSGTRSDCQNSFAKNAITLLIPQQQVAHKTSSQTPSFYLRSSTTSNMPLKFSLVDPEVSEPLAQENITLSTGINKIELPDGIKLTADKIYLWYVAIPAVCQNNSPDSAQYQDVLSSSVKYTPPSKQIQISLKNTKDDTQKAVIYAQNGFWYDSLQMSVDRQSTFLKQLLKSVNLII